MPYGATRLSETHNYEMYVPARAARLSKTRAYGMYALRGLHAHLRRKPVRCGLCEDYTLI
jgi:hypothetical protein